MTRILVRVLIVIIIGGIGFGVFKLIKIQNITCNACSAKLKDQISRQFGGQAKTEDILKTRSDLDKLLKNDRSVLEYSINFKLPNKYEVNVIQRKAVVAFLGKDGTLTLFDENGEIVENIDETNLPKITSFIALSGQQIKYLGNLMSGLYTLYGSEAGRVSADGLIVDNIKGKMVIFPIEGDIQVLEGSLALILSRLPSLSEASTIRTIDLRFKNPVLR